MRYDTAPCGTIVDGSSHSVAVTDCGVVVNDGVPVGYGTQTQTVVGQPAPSSLPFTGVNAVPEIGLGLALLFVGACVVQAMGGKKRRAW